MRILLTGFEPFGGRKVNTSWDLIRGLPPDWGGHEVRAVRLPVVYGAAWEAGAPAVEELKPDVILALGECSNTFFRLERVAINLRDAERPDNAGKSVRNEPVFPGGPAAYFSTLPLGRIHAAMKAVGIPAEYSLSAGGYLCNEVFYRLMRQTSTGRVAMAGFIHVPRAEEGADPRSRYPSNPLEIILSAVTGRPG
ncbi:MAG: pyroglutamyl-peptidase I [Elusimicrobiota bacterium]